MLADRITAIERIVRNHFAALTVKLVGDRVIDPVLYKSLIKAQVLDRNAVWRTDAITSAFLVGVASFEDADLLKSTLDRVYKSTGKLTSHEQRAIDAAKTRVGTQIKGLARKVSEGVVQAISNADNDEASRNLMVIRTSIGQGIADRKNAVQIAQVLAQKIQDVKKDWLRVATTELHNAMDHGRVSAILDRSGVQDPMVFKRPRPDACEHCQRLYLNNGVPRVFKLSDLANNGAGAGTGGSLRPVIGATHPWCSCTVQHLPEGMILDTDGSMRYVGLAKSRGSVERARL